LEVVTGAVPNHADAQRLLAQLYLDAGQEQEATCSLQALLDFYPDDTAAQLELESIQRKFAEESVEEDLELIEFTEADIVEEPGVGDQLVERCKPAVPLAQDPWSGIDNTDFTGTGTALSPELESVWSEPEQQIASVFERTEQDPLSTPTLAELYVEQGFPDKAIDIYHKILAGDPLNQAAAARLADLVSSSTPLKDGQVLSALDDEQPAAPVNDADLEVGAQRSMVTVLEGWLENIRGLRTCH
jgi:tetratricopeptide (TPR) repeat protein